MSRQGDFPLSCFVHAYHFRQSSQTAAPQARCSSGRPSPSSTTKCNAHSEPAPSGSSQTSRGSSSGSPPS